MKQLVFVMLVSSTLAIEVIFFGYFYLTGPHGYKKIKELHALHENIQVAVADMQRQVQELEKKLYDITTYPYYKEKIVREQLQMMRDNEVIYKLP